MHTVLELLNLTTNYFEQKKIDSPRLNAELLLAETLKCRRLDLYLSFDKPVNQIEVDRYREFVKRRGNREPLQYIIGDVEFYGLKFTVKPGVLIPRQETEVLIEAVHSHYPKEAELNILDIGSGSGILAVTLAALFPNSSVNALDKSSDALAIAKENAELHNVAERISFYEVDILKEEFVSKTNFHLVVSNPPYVSQDEFKTLQKEILDYEPDFAVTDFADGLTFYKKIIPLGNKILSPAGNLFFEVGAGQASSVEKIFEGEGFQRIETWSDYAGIKRVVKGEKR